MEVLLYNGTRVKITKVAREVLETPETTYNFEVEDYHTYYVSESSVLVHNTCSGDFADDGFNSWLNKGDANNTVYKGLSQSGDEVYTGITKQDLANRFAQHNSASGGSKNFSDLVGKYSNLTRNQARSIETYKIINDGKSSMNKILSISKKHRYFDQAMAWAKLYIGG